MPKTQSNHRVSKNILLKNIQEVAEHAGIKKKYLDIRGPHRAKVSLEILNGLGKKSSGKYVCVSSITPPVIGEGKTVTALGLASAFTKLKKRAVACLMQPSISSVLGKRGAQQVAGPEQVVPTQELYFGLAADSYSVQAAHNLCASFIDNVIFNGNSMDMDLETISWRRVSSVNDRPLRNVNIGMGSKYDGVPRKTGFDATDTSELMSIITLADGIKDLRHRIGKIIVGYTAKGKAITCDDLKVAGAMTALLMDAVKPNLMQTAEGSATFIHGSSYQNTGLGTSSVLADTIALKLNEYVIAESAYGSDTGAEKLFNIKSKISGIKPDVCVLVCSVRGIKMHSGDYDIVNGRFPREIARENVSAVERGLSNLEKHMENLKVFGLPVIVCINRYPDDAIKEIQAIERRASGLGAFAVTESSAYREGGHGAIELAKTVQNACKKNSALRYLYPPDLPIKEKIKRVAKTIYGAKEVQFSDEANKKALMIKKQKLDKMPVSIVKTPFSFSYNPKRHGRPHGFKFPVEDIKVYNGAGYIAAFSSNVVMMPGLPKTPRAVKIDINEEGQLTGLF